jgi:ABC-2 type transport system ATP-binding protein
VISAGEVLLAGEPLDAIRALDGRVWRRAVPTATIEEYKARLTVLSTRLSAGRSIVHVLADSRPEEGFEPVVPDLEDVYFGQLKRHAHAAPAA